MLEQTPRGTDPGNISRPSCASDLLRLSYPDALALFGALPAPRHEEMEGEYRAELLDQGPPVYLWIASWVVHARGRWLAKAFTPSGPNEGRGYNLFVIDNRLRRGTRMRTFVGPSRYDRRPAYHLDYAAYQGGLLGTMRDEVRKVSDGLYLGLGTAGYTRLMRRPAPFLLEGPVAPFAE